MILVYCFIGKLPEYAIDTVHQARLFFNGQIYFIVSDKETNILNILENNYNVSIIYYDNVIDKEFNKCIDDNIKKFSIKNNLKGREKLFIYSFERFFVLYQLMIQKNLSNILFLELDNLIYDDPCKWENEFNSKDMAYMYDNNDRCTSGICYIKNINILLSFTNYCKNFIVNTNKFLQEMTALYEFWRLHKDNVQLLPIHWFADNIPHEACENYDKYNETIFDAASLGIYLGGLDPYHTKGIIKKGLKGPWSAIDYTCYKYKWEVDNLGRKIPYVLYDNKWIRINNLHIHSKDLKSCLSM